MNVNSRTVTAVDISNPRGGCTGERKMMRVVIGRVSAQQRSGLSTQFFFVWEATSLPNQRGGYQHGTPLNHAWLALSVVVPQALSAAHSGCACFIPLFASGVWILTAKVSVPRDSGLGLACSQWGMDEAARAGCRLYEL